MTDRRIYYTKGYKYQLYARVEHQLPDHFLTYIEAAIQTKFISISLTGLMEFCYSYSWDGPSGPTYDSKDFMRASLIHDGGYQLIREGVIAPEARRLFDDELRRICLEDGMGAIRAGYSHWAVSKFGNSASIENKDILVAP
ncbi:MAG: hypothetical protein WC322_02740 [Candidatus Paceibacterota bacterium]